MIIVLCILVGRSECDERCRTAACRRETAERSAWPGEGMTWRTSSRLPVVFLKHCVQYSCSVNFYRLCCPIPIEGVGACRGLLREFLCFRVSAAWRFAFREYQCVIIPLSQEVDDNISVCLWNELWSSKNTYEYILEFCFAQGCATSVVVFAKVSRWGTTSS